MCVAHPEMLGAALLAEVRMFGVRMLGVRVAAPTALSAPAGPSSAQPRQGLRDHLCRVVLCCTHTSTLHAT